MAENIDKLQQAFDDPDVPKLYANGFALSLSNADVVMVLQLAARPVAVVNLSYTLAKTLQVRLNTLISTFEAKTDKDLLLTDDVDRIFRPE